MNRPGTYATVRAAQVVCLAFSRCLVSCKNYDALDPSWCIGSIGYRVADEPLRGSTFSLALQTHNHTQLRSKHISRSQSPGTCTLAKLQSLKPTHTTAQRSAATCSSNRWEPLISVPRKSSLARGRTHQETLKKASTASTRTKVVITNIDASSDPNNHLQGLRVSPLSRKSLLSVTEYDHLLLRIASSILGRSAELLSISPATVEHSASPFLCYESPRTGPKQFHTTIDYPPFSKQTSSQTPPLAEKKHPQIPNPENPLTQLCCQHLHPPLSISLLHLKTITVSLFIPPFPPVVPTPRSNQTLAVPASSSTFALASIISTASFTLLRFFFSWAIYMSRPMTGIREFGVSISARKSGTMKFWRQGLVKSWLAREEAIFRERVSRSWDRGLGGLRCGRWIGDEREGWGWRISRDVAIFSWRVWMCGFSTSWEDFALEIDCCEYVLGLVCPDPRELMAWERLMRPLFAALTADLSTCRTFSFFAPKEIDAQNPSGSRQGPPRVTAPPGPHNTDAIIGKQKLELGRLASRARKPRIRAVTNVSAAKDAIARSTQSRVGPVSRQEKSRDLRIPESLMNHLVTSVFAVGRFAVCSFWTKISGWRPASKPLLAAEPARPAQQYLSSSIFTTQHLTNVQDLTVVDTLSGGPVCVYVEVLERKPTIAEGLRDVISVQPGSLACVLYTNLCQAQAALLARVSN
ncbi:uncharacterized protein MYCFIDRAFT_171293 [Pseudocercospora fijiensis CIRAD86]|uniref:Uncharacterized protein n=1 Tax=Pseudocercospora fijiensis (strain CIRAD86) TaxID=383855 RepID=M3A2G1_PSEFD|nr:uncharacterized protein MYCFIDRAFT_171293 [Pseudocercospora fijiensis CIRAD86]EME85364.1 hypothetical protein MYCFIDRAFT_171293 [Pseudocercospora fijiensis CIRAD86]